MEIREQIEKVYNAALSLENEHIILDMGIIDENLANRIKEKTELDFSGYYISIDNYSIKHTLEKHGNPITEAKRGQINISKEDFFLLPEIIFNFDNVSYDKKLNKKGANSECLKFEKTIGDVYFVIKEIRTVIKKGKINRIVLQTMYKRKAPLP